MARNVKVKRIILIVLLGAALVAGEWALAEKQAGQRRRVADLHVVDCLLPSTIRRIGNTNYTAPRRPIRTTAADCRRRAGEYTD